MIGRIMFLGTSICSMVLLQLMTGCVSKPPLGSGGTGGYTPTDPMPVTVTIAGAAIPTDPQKLGLLDSADWRLITGETDANGNVTYGPANIAASGTNYTVTLDYIIDNRII
jgi:hypothetical protein